MTQEGHCNYSIIATCLIVPKKSVHIIKGVDNGGGGGGGGGGGEGLGRIFTINFV